MSRLKNFSRNLATSYLQLGVNVIYSLVSVPVILHWLPRSEFGLWAVLVQLMMYVVLMDLGINHAIARFLVDHKDDRGAGGYGSLIKASFVVSLVQGMVVLAIISAAAPWLTVLMKIPLEHRETFISLLRWQAVIAAVGFCSSPLQMMLTAHQRMDIASRQSIIGMILSLGLLVLFLSLDCGIYSFLYAHAIVAVLAPCDYFWQCRRLGLFPRAGEWGKISLGRFKELFLYGKDVFLINIGILLITGSQTVVVSYAFGLEAAAVWSVGVKFFGLMRQVTYLPSSAASPGMFEMSARDEAERLTQRFRNLAVLTTSLAIFLAVAYALCNSLFITVWTGGKIAWSAWNDVLLGVWIVIASAQTTHCSFAFVTKQIRGLAVVFFLEGVTCVFVSLTVGVRWGFQGVIGCSILCLLFFSCPYCLRRSAASLKLNLRTITRDWLRPSFQLAAVYLPLAAAAWFSTALFPTLWRLVIHVFVAVVAGGFLFVRFGLPPEMLHEVQTRLPMPAVRLLQRCGILPLHHST